MQLLISVAFSKCHTILLSIYLNFKSLHLGAAEHVGEGVASVAAVADGRGVEAEAPQVHGPPPPGHPRGRTAATSRPITAQYRANQPIRAQYYLSSVPDTKFSSNIRLTDSYPGATVPSILYPASLDLFRIFSVSLLF